MYERSQSAQSRRKHNKSTLLPIPKVASNSVGQSKQTTLPKIYYHNIRSLNDPKYNELKSFADSYDLIMLTESWLNVDKENLFSIDGFSLYTCHRGNKRKGGGVAIYAKNNLSLHKLCDMSTCHTSAIWLLLQQPEQPPIVISNIYHPPNLSKKLKSDTTNHLVSTIAKTLNKYPTAKILITGDFNDLDTSELVNIYPVNQIVNFPTRGSNRLDLVFTDIPEYISSGCIQRPPILCNDHCAIEIPSVNRLPTSKYTTIKKRAITPLAKLLLSTALNHETWDNLYQTSDVNEKVTIIHEKIYALLDKHCPMRSVRATNGKPSLSTPLIEKIKRAKLRVHHNKNRDSKLYFSKLLADLQKKELRKQTDVKVNQAVTGSRAWWLNVKKLTGDHKPSSNTSPLINMDDKWVTIDSFVENLNNFFLQSHDTATINFPEIPERSDDIPEVEEQHVYHLLTKIDTHKSTNSRDFPAWISQNNAHILCKPLTTIINAVFRTGLFPNMWKHAEITPLNKVKSPSTYKDHRPISLLFHLGKITEKVVAQQILKDLPKLDNQYAYTKQLSTTDALVTFSTEIATNLDNKDTTAVQFYYSILVRHSTA